jgi:serine/threonine-protein kinase
MNKFFEELKRRNVIKSTIAYLVVSWIIIQVATAVLPIFGAADWVLQAIVITLAVGLPVWIIVSWFYDITPEGLTKTPIDSEKQVYKALINKRTNAFIIASLSIAVVVMALKISNVFASNDNSQYSIAVMPFVNMSDDVKQEYFSDGLSEEIINQLALTPQLKVIGRTSSFSFKGKNEDLREIGRKLGASYILEGSVRKSGNVLRITVQLINSENGYHLYTETFDRELKDIFAIQDEISLATLKAIKIELFGEQKEAFLKRYTDNVEAYQLYLQGRYYVNKFTPDGFLKAIEFFDQAIAKDANYSIAYAGKSFCYTNLVWFNWIDSEEALPLGIQAAQKSLELDDKISENHLAVGRILLHNKWNVREAMASFKKALAINPNSAEIHVQLGLCLSLYGQNEEAKSHALIAENLDPLSILNLWYLTGIYSNSGDYDTVIANGQKIIDLEPNFFSGHMWLGWGYFNSGNYSDAITEMELGLKLAPGIYMLGNLGMAYGMAGDTLKAKEIINQIKAFDSGNDFMGNYDIGAVYASIEEFDTAFYHLNKAVENREGQALWIKYVLNNDSKFYEDPRYTELLNKMNVIY